MQKKHCDVCKNGYHNYSPISLKWLEEMEKKYNCKIKHAENGGEKMIKINNKRYHVDGFCEEKKLIFEFHGCYFHGHPKDKCSKNRLDKWEETNRLNKKKFTELYDCTIKKIADLKSLGYEVIEMWECKFKNQN